MLHIKRLFCILSNNANANSWRRTSFLALLGVILGIGIVMVGCEESTPTYNFTCQNGTPSNGHASLQNTTRCTRCNSGFILTEAHTCVKHAYVCENGTPSGDDATADNITKCAECNSGFMLANDTCVATGYTCQNGTALEGINTSGNAEYCTECHEGYYLVNNQCSACPTTIHLDATGDTPYRGTLCANSQSTITIPLSREASYTIAIDLTADVQVQLLDSSNTAQHVKRCPYSFPARWNGISVGGDIAACATPTFGQEWFALPLEDSRHTLRLQSTAKSTRTYWLTIQEHTGTQAISTARLPLDKPARFLTNNEPFNFWVHIPTGRWIERRAPQVTANCRLFIYNSDTISLSGNVTSFHTIGSNTWLRLGSIDPVSNTSTAFAILSLIGTGGNSIPGTGCQLQFRMTQ